MTVVFSKNEKFLVSCDTDKALREMVEATGESLYKAVLDLMSLVDEYSFVLTYQAWDRYKNVEILECMVDVWMRSFSDEALKGYHSGIVV